MSDLVPVKGQQQTQEIEPAAAYLGTLTGAGAIRIGSRTSPMAMAQARHVAAQISALVPGTEVTISGIVTTADQWSGDLAQLGGKGLFIKEIDRALLMGQIDMAVHCMKDVPGDVPLPRGLAFAAYLPRDDIRDCVVFPERDAGKTGLDDLPAGARIGTSSVRRKAQLSRHRPDLMVHRIRGNVNARLLRLDNGDHDALILARAGLERIGYGHRAAQTLSTDVMCPAVGAGIIGLQCRDADPIRELLRLLDDNDARTHVTAERAMLHGLQGHCNSPIAGHAYTTPDGQLALRGMVFTRDGGEFVHAMEWGPVDKPAELGAYIAGDLLRKGARDLIAGIPH